MTLKLKLFAFAMLAISNAACVVGAQPNQQSYVYPAAPSSHGKAHLFILSGQSNMERLDPAVTFTPAVVEALGEDSVIIVKDAVGGQSIRRWYKEWTSVEGEPSRFKGDLYDRLMKQVNASIAEREIETVTFLWMQGEHDASHHQFGVYQTSLEGLFNQLKQDLQRDDINFVIGRLSDFSLDSGKHPEWQAMREFQVAFAEADPRGAWVDTDDLNDIENPKTGVIRHDVHYSREGYKLFGKRLADQAITLVRQSQNQ